MSFAQEMAGLQLR